MATDDDANCTAAAPSTTTTTTTTTTTATLLLLFNQSYFSELLQAGLVRYGDGAGNTVEENSSIFSLIRMR